MGFLSMFIFGSFLLVGFFCLYIREMHCHFCHQNIGEEKTNTRWPNLPRFSLNFPPNISGQTPRCYQSPVLRFYMWQARCSIDLWESFYGAGRRDAKNLHRHPKKRCRLELQKKAYFNRKYIFQPLNFSGQKGKTSIYKPPILGGSSC